MVHGLLAAGCGGSVRNCNDCARRFVVTSSQKILVGFELPTLSLVFDRQRGSP